MAWLFVPGSDAWKSESVWLSEIIGPCVMSSGTHLQRPASWRGWTDFAPLGMEWSRWRQRMHSEFSRIAWRANKNMRQQIASSADCRPRDDAGRVVLRQSSILAFQDCRRRYYWSAVEGLERVRIEPTDPRIWGTAVHAGLEKIWAGAGIAEALVALSPSWKGEDADSVEALIRAREALLGYVDRWAADGAEESGALLALESEFSGPLMLDAERESERFSLAGRVDGAKYFPAGQRGGAFDLAEGIYLLEHKTRRVLDNPRHIWADFQTLLYGDVLERAYGEPIAGVAYDVIARAGLRQRRAETTDEFRVRVQAMIERAERGELGRRLRRKRDETQAEFIARRIAKGRDEAMSARRIDGESCEDYESRLAGWYSEPDRFLRVATATNRARRLAIIENVAEVADEIAYAEDTGRWTRSEGACHRMGRECDYWPICSSGDDPRVIASEFRQKGSDDEPAEDQSTHVSVDVHAADGEAARVY